MSNKAGDTTMKECWKEIKKTHGKYSISNFGRVKMNSHTTNRGEVVYHWREHIVNTHPNPSGYLTFNYNSGHSSTTIFVHVEVARAFIDNPNNLGEVHHIDYNKLNCNVSNLKWISHRDNIVDKELHYNKESTMFYKEGDIYKRRTNRCMVCGRTITDSAKLCRSCQAKKSNEHRYHKNSNLTVEVVSASLKANKGNFSKTARGFDISVAGLRKRCKKYGLSPYSGDWKQ